MALPAHNLTLRFISGTDHAPFAIKAGTERVSIGRSAECDLCLMHDGVSRRHASLRATPEGWYIIHHGERSSTRINGERLSIDRPSPVVPGDVVAFGPCTCRVSSGVRTHWGPEATVANELAATERIEIMPAAAPLGRHARRMAVLMRWLGRITEPAEPRTVADQALQAAVEGSGFPRAAVLVPEEDGGLTVLSFVSPEGTDPSGFRFSRSLVDAALRGATALLRQIDGRAGAGLAPEGGAKYAASLAELDVHSAVCVPVLVGEHVEACLYFDARGQERAADADAVGFCEAVARVLALSMSERRRRELERRKLELTAQLSAAHDVQRLILPAPAGDVGPVKYVVRTRPGEFVAGDLFDAFTLDDGRAVVMMGDATGHGAASGMMMAMTQSHLHAELRCTGRIESAVRAANRYLVGHAEGGRTVSLWLGVFSPGGRCDFIDAGHGHWSVLGASGIARAVESLGGVPLGIDPDFAYEAESFQLESTDRLVLYTDGIVERRCASGEEFGVDRLWAAVAASPSERSVQAVFDAADAFAGSQTLLDDATVGIVFMSSE